MFRKIDGGATFFPVEGRSYKKKTEEINHSKIMRQYNRFLLNQKTINAHHCHQHVC